MSCICRTCLSELTNDHYVDINLSEFAEKQLKLCIPELNLDLVLEPVLCLKCVEALNTAYDFKICCLQTEQRINAHVETLRNEHQHVELDAVLGNNYNGINSMAVHCGNDITNDLNAVHGHSRTRQDLEDYKDANEECSVTSETFEDCVEVNYDGVKEESIKIEEHEWDSFIKNESEMLDTGSDDEFENGFTLESQDCNGSSQQQDVDSNEQLEDAVNGAAADDIFLPKPSRSDACEEHNESSVKNSTKFSGLLRQCNQLDPMNYNANDENCNSTTISAASSTKQGNSVTKSQVEVFSMEPNNSSSSVRLLRQRKVNEPKIADTSNIHSIKRRFKTISSIKSHSMTENLCKSANRRVRYRCHQKEKNIEEQIVAKSELHSELLRDCKMVLTRMDISSAKEMLNIDNCAVMKDVQTQEKKSSHLKCDMNIKTKNTTATEAEANLHSVIDRSPLHLKHSNTFASNNSNTYTNVSLQHFINSNNLSVENQELSISSQFLNTTGKNSYKCDQCDYACSNRSSFKLHIRNHSREKPYKCSVCNYSTSLKSDFNDHLRTHTGENPYKCDECDYACSKKSSLIVHMRSHTQEKPYKCNVCNYAGSQKSHLDNHLHTGEKPYKCGQCDYACSIKASLTRHMRKHTGEKPYKCVECDYACSIKSNLKLHNMSKHTGERPYKCNVCNYAGTKQTDLNNHRRTHTGEKPYKCDQCDYACSQKGSLLNHMRKHSGEKPYKCNVCNYATSQKSDFNDHLRTHTGEKPYKCDQCEYASCRKKTLKIHSIMNHTGEKPYKCNVCNYESSQKADFNGHLRTHPEENPYTCGECDYACSKKSCLIVHMRSHTQGKPYKCNVCNYRSSQKSHLNNHLRTHTGEKPYKCYQCDFACSIKTSLRRHMRKHTGEKPYKCVECDYACSIKSYLKLHNMSKHTGERPYKCNVFNYAGTK